MQILLVSDLHGDINPVQPDLASAEILVIAGDVGQTTSESLTADLTHLCSQYPHVVYVMGNHEYYQNTLSGAQGAIQKLTKQLPNLHWLQNSTVTIGGQRFVGTTLWFPQTIIAETLSFGFTDFTWIRNFRQWWGQEHKRAVQYLIETLQPGDVVVTHHTPSYRSVAPLYRLSQSNVFYCNELEDLIEKTSPKLWCHGHVHTAQDYQLGQTRVLCNPYGYTSRGENRTFNPALLITL